MLSAWKSEHIPAKQRRLVHVELMNMYKGNPPLVYRVLAQCLQPYVVPGCSILEIGCASGYYYEILKYLLNINLSYIGVDYSTPLITMAKDYYPNAKFCVADDVHLPFGKSQFFVVIYSCILLHVPNFREHIKESARLSKQYVVAHRTPVAKNPPCPIANMPMRKKPSNWYLTKGKL